LVRKNFAVMFIKGAEDDLIHEGPVDCSTRRLVTSAFEESLLVRVGAAFLCGAHSDVETSPDQSENRIQTACPSCGEDDGK